MKVFKAGDWSIGLNSATGSSLSQAMLFAAIGPRLREVYSDVVEEGSVPEHLAPFIEKLEARSSGETEDGR